MENTGDVGSTRDVAAQTSTGGAIPADTLAARLLLARHHAGRLSQREAAEKSGLSYASWSNWEEGRRPRDVLEVVQKIADALDIDHDWLLFGGPLLPARGKPTKRSEQSTGGYLKRATGPRDTRPKGRPGKDSPVPTVRRPQLINRSRPVVA